MKKILSLILVVAMIFTLVACTSNDGNKNPVNGVEDITENTQSTTENQENTEEGGNETIPSDNEDADASKDDEDVTTESTEEVKPSTDSKPDDTESNVTPNETTKPTETTKPADTTKPTESTKPTTHEHSYTSKVTKNATCTENGVKTFTCSCGSTYTEKISKTGHNWGEWKTTKEPTTSSEGTSQRKCTKCSETESKSIAKLPATENSVYYVNYQVVSKTLPNAYYIDGVDMLTKMFGENKAFQTGDTIVYQINMSNNGNNGFEVIGASGCTASKNGNKVTVHITGEYSSAEWAFKTVNKDGSNKTVKIVYDVVQYSGNITNSNGCIEDIFKKYALEKYGIETNPNLSGENGYTANRTEGNDPSITGNHGEGFYGTADDFFWKADKSNWVKYVLDIISEYNRIGIKEWKCCVKSSYFSAVARK